MSDDRTDFDHAPELEPELNAAVWSVIQEPLDVEAVSRVKERAMALGEDGLVTPVSESELPVSKDNRTRTLLIMRLVQALAASIVVVVGGVLWSSSSNSAFAQVIEKLRAAKTLTYRVEVDHEQFDQPVQQRVMVNSDGRCRHEAGPLVSIFDPAGNLRLHLDALARTAVMDHPTDLGDRQLSDAEMDEVIGSLESSDLRLSGSELDELKKSWESLGVEFSETEMNEVMKYLESGEIELSEAEVAEMKLEVKKALESTNFGFSDLDWIEYLQNHVGKPDRKLGRRMIEGRELDGFVVLLGSVEYTIWLDPVTDSLVRIEYEVSAGVARQGKTVMKDFRFDVPLDDTLFSYDPPQGYDAKDLASLLPEAGIPLASEKTLVEALRGFTNLSGGKFPNSLANWTDWLGVIEDPQSEEFKVLASQVGVVSYFLSQMAKEEYEYLGSGKSTDDERSIVFWHRAEGGALRAVYSDLTVSEIQESDVP